MRPASIASFAVLAISAAGLARAAPEAPKLSFPLACTIGQSCEVQHYLDRDPGPGVLDYRCGHRTYEGHNGVDIRLLDMAQQRRGVDVLAAAAGKVARLRDGVQDISIRAPGAPSVANMECGNGVVIDHGGGWETQYCHVARGSVRVKQGDVVKAGQPIARVGLSGNTEFPHLHITVRHDGQVVDPFAPAPGRCGPQPGLWTPQAAKAMAYKAGAILNAGISGAAVTMDMIENGQTPPATSASPVVVAYMRGIELEKGDELEMVLTGPAGVLAKERVKPLDNDKAQQFHMIGRKRPADGWPSGVYSADLKVWRGGAVVLSRRVTARL